MAWNPNKEVAVARDAARALDDAAVCVVVWLTKDGRQVGMASYGKTKALCNHVTYLGNSLYHAAIRWLADNPPPQPRPVLIQGMKPTEEGSGRCLRGRATHD